MCESIDPADREGRTLLPTFEIFLKKRRRSWEWMVCAASGDPVMGGLEISRAASRYSAYRALFLLLSSAVTTASPPERARPKSHEIDLLPKAGFQRNRA